MTRAEMAQKLLAMEKALYEMTDEADFGIPEGVEKALDVASDALTTARRLISTQPRE